MNGGYSLLIRFFIALFSTILIVYLSAANVNATDTESYLFKLETDDATIFTELVANGDTVSRISTASRTTYQYQQFESESLANIAMGIRSQNYNSRDGYKHFYSITPSIIEELLVVDYGVASEHLSLSEQINLLIQQGYVRTDRYPAEENFILTDDLYVSGNIVLEYEDDTLFNRVEIDYIGDRIFIMTSILEPSLEYYGFQTIDDFIQYAENHRQHVNSEGYSYNYYVEDEFLGETTEIRFYLLSPQSFFMELYDLNEADYYTRYPNGVDAVEERVNDYISRGYEVIRHTNNSPEFERGSFIDFERLYNDAAESVIEENHTDIVDDIIEVPEEELDEEVDEEIEDELEEGIIEEESEEQEIIDEDTESDEVEETEEKTEEESEEQENITEELEDAPDEEIIEEEIPNEFGDSVSLEQYSSYGNVAVYQGSDTKVNIVHQDGVISHIYMEHTEAPFDVEFRLEEEYNRYQLMDKVPGYNSRVTRTENTIYSQIGIDYNVFSLPESYVSVAEELLPIYMSYRLSNVHQTLKDEGYNYQPNEVNEESTRVILEHAHQGQIALEFENGNLISMDEDDEDKRINDVIDEYVSLGYVIISVDK